MVADQYKAKVWRSATITVNEKGSIRTSSALELHGHTPEVVMVMGNPVKKIPVERFPVTINVFTLSGKHVWTQTVHSTRERVVFHNAPKACVVTFEANGVTNTKFILH